MIITPVNVQYLHNQAPFSPSMNGYKRIRKTLPSSQLSNNKFINELRDYFEGYPKRINYTWQHKKAFLAVEKKLCGKNSIRGYLHDVDKLFMYIIGVPKKTAHNIHVSMSPHHLRNGKVKSPLMTVIDWECARYTKADKPLSAREFYEKFYVEKQKVKFSEIEDALNKLGL